MTVLITRPAPECHQLVELLTGAGIKAIAQPLLSIRPGKQLPELVSQLNRLKKNDILVAVSGHAVHMAHNYLTEKGVSWPENVHYIAVGHKTAAALKQATGQDVIVPTARYDSEGVLALPQLQQVAHRRVVILRGNGGRELIYQTLRQRRALAEYCETYQRCWLTLDGEQLTRSWQQQQVSQLAVTSGEQLEHLCRIIPDKDKAWFYQCQLFVPSQRIATLAQQLGFKHISTVSSAANEVLLTTLSDNCTMG